MGAYFKYETLIGNLWIAEKDSQIVGISFWNKFPDFEEKETSVIKKAIKQLQEYFSGKRNTFDLPLNPLGTTFQQAVWTALLKIPYAETYSYKRIAEMIGNPKASRAVGLANNRNPIAIIIPCHRVVGSNGKLIGYAGGLNIKETLLELEKK